MDKKEIEELIDKKVLEAKLTIAEKRLHLVLILSGAMVAILGVFLPLWLTNRSTDRMDNAIEQMRKEFKELAGIQLRKPELESFLEGKDLETSVLKFFISEKRVLKLELKNLGDAVATNIKIRLYIETEQNLAFDSDYMNWIPLDFSEEPNFSKGFESPFRLFSLNPKESFAFNIELGAIRVQEAQIPALLKIYYGQPQPKRIPFSIVIEKRNQN